MQARHVLEVSVTIRPRLKSPLTPARPDAP